MVYSLKYVPLKKRNEEKDKKHAHSQWGDIIKTFPSYETNG